ncbi:MAG: LysR family transcriptional regulator [Actinomycetia bacterium]|nr:LysR family transcriptional regulator [Actinomycetes bacterium]
MDLRQLEYFVTVADERHFTRAAERLFISQSGLSASIRALEKDLGATLFTRNTRRVELTEAGRALLDESRRTLASVEAARDAVAAVQGLRRGTLSVGTEQCLGAVDVPAELARFHAAHPGVELLVQQAGSAHLIEEVRLARLDLAFVAQPTQPDDGVTFIRLVSEPMVLICPPQHPLAERDVIDWLTLADAVFVDFHPDWGSRRVTDRGFAAAGLMRQVASEVNDVHTLLDLVDRGLGVAIVPGPIARKKTGKLATVALGPDAPTWDVAIAVPAGSMSLAATTFLAPIRGRFQA